MQEFYGGWAPLEITPETSTKEFARNHSRTTEYYVFTLQSQEAIQRMLKRVIEGIGSFGAKSPLSRPEI